MEILENCIQLFEQEKYEEAIVGFINLYNRGELRTEILQFIYDCFINPNHDTFKENYSVVANKTWWPSFDALSIDFIPVSDSRYYLYSREAKDFYDYIEVPSNITEKYKKEAAVLLFANISDIRIVLSVLSQQDWAKCYVLLEDNKEIFLSFFKLSEISKVFEDKMVIFQSRYDMLDYFIEHNTERLPECAIGEDISKTNMLISIIGKARVDYSQKEEDKNASELDIPESFFAAEIRDGFQVTSLMKHAWAAEMELISFVDKICQQHNLRYYAEGGTLLGAIRHKGFIPWDDDVDIMMFRDDYNKFIKIIKEFYDNKYEMTGFGRGKDGLEQGSAYYSTFSPKMDNWEYGEYLNTFHDFPFPVAIDIFPLDFVPKDEEVYNVQKVIANNIMYILHHMDELIERGELENKVKKVEGLLNAKITRGDKLEERLFDYLVQMLSIAKKEESEEVALSMYFVVGGNRNFSIEWFEPQKKVAFETMSISIPVMYDKVLEREFGKEYMCPKQIKAKHDYPFYKIPKKDIEDMLVSNGFGDEIEKFYENPLRYNYAIMLSNIGEI